MPGLRFWLHCVGAFVLTFGTSITGLLTQAMMNGTQVHLYAWLIASLGGLGAAFIEGNRSWPTSSAR